MSWRDCLEELSARDVILWPDGDSLAFDGPEEYLTEDIIATLREHKADILGYLRSAADLHPPSHGQKALWLDHRLAPDSFAYNSSFCIRILSPVDPEALRRTFQLFVNRHPALRTNIVVENEAPMQRIHRHREVILVRVDVGGCDEKQIHDRVVAAHRQLFDLAEGPLFRLHLFTRRPDDHILLFTVHHSTCDGWSLSLMFDEIRRLYPVVEAGDAPDWPPLRTSYVDYVSWQAEILRDQGEALWTYWRDRLAGELPVLNLPTDRPHSAVRSDRGASMSFALDSATTERVRSLARSEGITPYTVLLAAFQTLLHRYSGQDDILLGSLMAGRGRAEFAPVFGYFVNPVVMRADFSKPGNFRALLQQTAERAREAFAHQHFPFPLLVERLQPKRLPGISPIIQVVFAMQPLAGQEVIDLLFASADRVDRRDVRYEFGGLKVSPYPISQYESQFDLFLEFFDGPDSLLGAMKYNAGLFDEATIRRLLANLQTLLTGITDNPDRMIADLPLLGADERRLVLNQWNDTASDYPDQECLYQLIERQAARTPEHIAIVYDSLSPSEGICSLTYRKVNEQANRFARHLRGLGAGPGVSVGIHVERSPAMLWALLGITKSGAAYVPLDPNFPRERIGYMIEDARLSIIVTERGLRESLPNSDARILCLDEEADRLSAYGPENLPPIAGPGDPMYLIYTSGSTGRPKGVMVGHRSVVNFLCSMRHRPGMGESDSLLAVTTLSFDIAVLELYLPLLVGGRVVLSKQDAARDGGLLQDLIARHGITLMQATPATWQMLFESGWAGAPDLKVLCGGEAMPWPLAAQITAGCAELWNLYGPTETTVWSTILQVPSGETSGQTAMVPIGCPIANTIIHIVDPSNLQPMPIGAAGELLIGGAGLAHGYHGRPELTADRFIGNRFGPGRLYRTGDLARYLPDGCIEYLGRIDQQIKLRGHRIELGEIEAVLTEHDSVRQAVVVAREDQPGNKQLAAYIIPAAGESGAAAAQHVEQWRSIWQSLYRDVASARSADPTFNVVGWESSYTGQPIPAEEMESWVTQAVEEVRAFAPDRILEIGCGTGLLMARLAGGCSDYLGLDYSAEAVAYLEHLKRSIPGLSHVRVEQRLAHDLAGIPRRAFDCVILNSVIQYFPDADYLLRVVEGALEMLRPGGIVYVGDVRDFRLLSAFHASVQAYRADDDMTVPQMRDLIRQRVQDEEEFLVAPDFFRALPARLPAVTGVDIRLERGRHRNEMTRFRYHAVLYTGTEGGATVSQEEIEWRDLADIEARLDSTDADIVRVCDIPNLRIQAEFLILDALERDDLSDVGALRALLWQQAQGVDPEALWALGERCGRVAHLSPAAAPDRMNASFRRPGVAQRETFRPEAADLRALTNAPLAKQRERHLVSSLRAHLQDKLPEYMMPAAYVLMDSFPLTPNGKVDRKALPAPSRLSDTRGGDFVAPRTPLERSIALLWADILGLDAAAVSAHANFFEMGGHSLLATQVIAGIRRTLGVTLGLRALFAAPTVAGNAQAVAEAQREHADAEIVESFPQIVPDLAQRHHPFPLTPVQHAYWVGRSGALELGNVATHIYWEIDIAPQSGFDLQRLNRAWQQMVERHEMLRAVVQPDSQQRILEQVPEYRFHVEDLTAADAQPSAARLAEIRGELSHLALPADRWPLFDICVSRYHDESGGVRERLHISLDFLFLDGWSLSLLFKEWLARYHDPGIAFPALGVSFRDYVLAEKAFEQSEPYRRNWAYWQARLATLPPPPDLPLRVNPKALASPTFTRRTAQLGPQQWDALKAKGNRLGITPSVILLTAYAHILGEWSRRPWFTLNLTIFNRLPFHPEIDQVIGDFTPLMMLEVDNTQGNTLEQRAERIQRQLWEDFDHRIVNGVQVLREWAKLHNHGFDKALMPVVFTSVLSLDKHASLFETFGEIVFNITQTPQVWLDHQVLEEDGRLIFHWDAVEGLFAPGMLDDMFGAYCRLLERLAAGEAVWREAGLSLVPAGQLAQREAVNATAEPVSELRLHELFLAQLAERGDAPAVLTLRRTLSYRELHARAARVCRCLLDRGVEPNTLVAVVMEKGWEQVVAVLGIHLAGAAYLPIDPGLPTERRDTLLRQGGAAIALTQSAVETRLVWPAGIERLAVDLLDGTDEPVLALARPNTDLAYVIYTSGSTGLPKGVAIDHRGAVNTVLDVNRRYGIGAGDRVLALSALNFDLSVYDIFGLLGAGGALVLPEAESRLDPGHWVELMGRFGITVWNTVPALTQMLADHCEGAPGAGPPDLRVVMMSGDWIPVPLPDRIHGLWPAARLYSMGGATEASIWSILHPIDRVDPAWRSIPYGKPMANQSWQVLDAQGNPRPVWVPGELYIGGIGLAQGYWNDPERTAASFVTHPRTGERLYRTGDFGRYLPDGSIEFLGREDFQVKIRGHRIELGEIEAALLQHPSVREAVVDAAGPAQGTRQLVAYVVMDEAAGMDKGGVAEAHMPAAAEGLVLDPIDRLAFRLSQPGLRRFPEGAGIALPQPPFDDQRRDATLSRQSYRRFQEAAIPLAAFGDWLGELMQRQIDDAPLPKYRYGSAGSLYPVQAYLYVKPGRVADLPGGLYYHDPRGHRLVPLGEDADFVPGLYRGLNETIFAQSAFALFLVGQMEAIRPLYGAMARDFVLLEAGTITQLLMMEAPAREIGLCPIGSVEAADGAALHQALGLGPGHEMVHSLLGGRIDPAQRTIWLETGSKPTAAASWQTRLHAHLTAKLPAYMLPEAYVRLDALPLTANGKIDRAALPAPHRATRAEALVAPETETERRLAAIWAELLGVEEVSVVREFGELGFNSVHMVQVANHLRKQLQRPIPLIALFEHPTIRALARYLDKSGEEQPEEQSSVLTQAQQRAQARLAQRQKRPR